MYLSLYILELGRSKFQDWPKIVLFGSWIYKPQSRDLVQNSHLWVIFLIFCLYSWWFISPFGSLSNCNCLLLISLSFDDFVMWGFLNCWFWLKRFDLYDVLIWFYGGGCDLDLFWWFIGFLCIGFTNLMHIYDMIWYHMHVCVCVCIAWCVLAGCSYRKIWCCLPV